MSKAEKHLLEYIRCRHDPAYFIFNYCLTTDSLTDENRKPFPRHPYIEYLIECYKTHNRIIVAKSRQMMVTWTFCALLLWQAMFHEAQLCIIQNKKAEDADDHIQNKIKVMWENLPPWLKEQKPSKCIKNNFTIIHDPKATGSDSLIRALPQGEAAIRMYTASVILSDEMAFQEEAGDAFAAAAPTLRGSGKKRGRFVGVSTPAGKNFFYRMWDDNHKIWEGVMTGVMQKQNPNKFLAVRLHYTADPDKDEEWVKEGKAEARADPGKWEREQEIDFSVQVGQKYFPEYKVGVHEKHDLLAIPGRPLLRTWDWGYRHPGCVVSQLNTKDQWVVLWEHLGEDISTHNFAKHCIQMCDELFPEHRQRQFREDATDYIDFGDIAGTHKTSKGDKSDFEIMAGYHIYPIAKKMPISLGLKIIRQWLLPGDGDEPRFLIDANKCPLLAEGFRGAFHFKEDKDGQLREEEYASDNECVHLMDALKYNAALHSPIAMLYKQPDYKPPKKVESLDNDEYAQWHRTHIQQVVKNKHRPQMHRRVGC